MEDSECGLTKFWATPACFFLDYVFAYRKDGVPKIVKAENSTDNPDHILWQNVGGSVGRSGQKGKNFYLCPLSICAANNNNHDDNNNGSADNTEQSGDGAIPHQL